MKLTAKLTNLGVELSVAGGEGREPLKPAGDANQETPRRSYVYAHMDSNGKIFYVGKGEGRRAWSRDRHPIWRRYVEKHLGGTYQVRILQDNLSPGQAEEVEAAWVAQCSEGLVNWQNVGRKFDLKALERFHRLRDANRILIHQAKAVEMRDLPQAARMYAQAVEAIGEYAFIEYESGLVGQLVAEEDEELGRFGEVEAVERLTLCLIRLGRAAEAAQCAKDYFDLYRRDQEGVACERISERIQKALARTQKRTLPGEGRERASR